MDTELEDIKYLQKTSEGKKALKMKSWVPAPSSRLLWALCAICGGLFIVIIILIIAFRVPGERAPDPTVEKQIRNLSDSMTSRVVQLSKDGTKTLERIQQLTEVLNALKADISRDPGEKPADRSLEYQIGNLSDSVNSKVSRLSQEGTKLLEKLQDVDKTLRAVQANISITLGDKSRDQSLENVIGNLSDNMNLRVAQLTQDGTKMMEILDQMNHTLSLLQANNSTKALQSDAGKILSEVLRLSEEVKKLKINESCPSGWKGFRSSCYFFSAPARTWSDAKLRCENVNSHLVTMNTVEEQRFLLELTQRRNAWIGLMYRPYIWTWADGTNYNSLPTNWAPGKPNPYMYGNNVCAYMGSDGKWIDIACTQTFSSLCERDML